MVMVNNSRTIELVRMIGGYVYIYIYILYYRSLRDRALKVILLKNMFIFQHDYIYNLNRC